MSFRRRARPRIPAAGDGGDARGRAARQEEPHADREPSVTGTYLTDGRSLFRIQHAITEADGLHLDEPLLELEDCATLELILCSAGALERLGLRPVDPAADGDGERARRAPGRDGLPTPVGPLPIGHPRAARLSTPKQGDRRHERSARR